MISYALAASSVVHPQIQSASLYNYFSLLVVPSIMISDNSSPSFRFEQNAVPLICWKTSSRLHSICSIYRPFLVNICTCILLMCFSSSRSCSITHQALRINLCAVFNDTFIIIIHMKVERHFLLSKSNLQFHISLINETKLSIAKLMKCEASFKCLKF